MTEFSFDLFMTPVPTKFISKFSIYKTMPYWSAMHLGNVLAWTPILFTYNRIRIEMENTERGPGGGAPRKIFAVHAFQIAGKCLLSSVNYSRLFKKLTATQKYNVCLKKSPLQEYKRQHRG